MLHNNQLQGKFRRRNLLAVSLVETMVAMAVGVTAIGLTVAATTDLYKKFTAASAYRNIHKDARKALAFISRDIRSATNLTSFATSDITMDVMDSSSAIASIRYQLINDNLIRTKTLSGVITTNSLTENVTAITFERWNNPGVLAANNTETHEIRVYLTVTNAYAFRTVSDLLQTRVLMRNK